MVMSKTIASSDRGDRSPEKTYPCWARSLDRECDWGSGGPNLANHRLFHRPRVQSRLGASELVAEALLPASFITSGA